MKKSIVFVLPNLDSGGVEKVAINYLKQLAKDKYNVILIVFNKTNDLLSLIPNSVNLIDLKTNSTKYSLIKLIKLFNKLKPDVVYTGHSRVAVLVQFSKLFTGRFKHLARMQSMPSLEKKYKKYGLIQRVLYKIAFQRADVVLAETQDMKDDAINSFSIKECKVKVMHNPLDKFLIEKSIISSYPLANTSNEIVAIASGRLCKDKDYDTLIKATIKVLELYPHFKLYILGRDDGEENTLQNLILKNNLQQVVVLKGFQSNPYKYYSSSSLFILSSRREGFPNVLIENYYLNTPIVATKCVPIISELINDGINGYTCEIEDIDSLAESIIKCIKNIKRENIKNPEYIGSKIEELF